MVKSLRINSVQNIAGFSSCYACGGETAGIIVKDFYNSDQKDFYGYLDEISRIYLKNFPIDHICNFLILIHKDLTADLWVNNVPIQVSIIGKKTIKGGDLVRLSDIADISSIHFTNIEICDTDNIVFCFKKGWKFGLYFDFSRHNEDCISSSIDDLYNELGYYYKYLSFQEEYSVLQNETISEQMFYDGWFPFIQIIGKEFRNLSKIYNDLYYKDTEKFNYFIENLIKKFDRNRIESFVNNWWNKKVFLEKQLILKSGIEAYLKDTQDGFINCIKNLYSEIEGIVRLTYHENKKSNPKFKELVKYIEEEAKSKFLSINSLGFPEVFIEYLKEFVFKDFDLDSENINFSRHSTSHGVANANDYTKTKALQAILILDQLYYYL